MAWPEGVISRALAPDEIKIFFDTRAPIPVGVLGKFLVEVEKATRYELGPDWTLQVVDLALGSQEVRLRAARKRPRRSRRDDGAVYEKESLRISKASLACGIISTALAVGALAKPASDITNNYGGTSVYVESPRCPPLRVTGDELRIGAERYKEQQQKPVALPRAAEIRALVHHFEEGTVLKLAGTIVSARPTVFRTVKGNRFPVIYWPGTMPSRGLLKVDVIVERGPDGELGLVVNQFEPLDNS